MFCPECGYKNVEGAAFCENCGTKLTGMTENINQKETSYKKTGEKATKKSVSLGKINKMLLIEIPIRLKLLERKQDLCSEELRVI